jgi:hypothetical protein
LDFEKAGGLKEWKVGQNKEKTVLTFVARKTYTHKSLFGTFFENLSMKYLNHPKVVIKRNTAIA